MRVVKWFFIFFISGLAVLVGTLYFRLGAYKPVHFEVREVPAFSILYKQHTGPYHKIVPVIEEVERWAKQNKLPCPRTFGEYLDDPRYVDPDRLRSHGGCVLEGVKAVAGGAQVQMAGALSFTVRWPTGFSFRRLSGARYLTARFEGSPSIGPFVVYPKAQEHMRSQFQTSIKSPVIELYKVIDESHMQTEYLFKAP